MGDVEYKPKKGALRALMKSEGVSANMLGRGARVASYAQSIGRGKYGYNVRNGRVSSRCIVYTANGYAIYHDRKANILLKSMDAGR